MSNPFLALDLSDDENITVAKPQESAAAKPDNKKTTHPRGVDAPQHKPRKELKKEEADLMQKKKHPAVRGVGPQPEVTIPQERSKMGIKKEEHVHTHKKNNEGRGRQFDRHSGTGRGRETKKGGAGGHNWGKAVEDTPAPAQTPDLAEATDVKEEVPVVEVDPNLSLEEYEKQQMLKRSGAAFQTKEARKVTSDVVGVVYKKSEEEGEGDYIKLSEDHHLKKHPGHFKNKTKNFLEIDFKVRDTSVPEAPRGPRRDGGNREPREGGGGSGAFRGSSRGGRGGGPTRGGGPARGGRGGFRGGSSGQINTADQSAFPKLGEGA